MEELLDLLKPSLLEIAGVLLSAFAGFAAVQIKAWFDTKQKRAIVESTVQYVEQVGRALGSEEKFALAKKKALEWLNAKGLKVVDVELEVLIEAAVNSFFEHYELEHGQKSGAGTIPVAEQQ